MSKENEYFNSEKKGEMFELKQELQSDKKDRKLDALKRIINFITTGKDMSELFPDVVSLIQTNNIEQKKLVYIYLTNYSHLRPELALLAVNTFVRDCDDSNPLVRSMAVRAMGCIRASNISEYLCEPLRKCLSDSDPYVRKTSAICVLKLFNCDPELVVEQGFVLQLKKLISDANPMVLMNALSALLEMASISKIPESFLPLNMHIVSKLLSAMNECTEWGQITILDALMLYTPETDIEAQNICERITSRLSHANSALILSTIKLLLKTMPYLNPDIPLIKMIFRKMGPPLVSMLSQEPEIQYVVLRNVNLIVHKYPDVIRSDYKAFFVKYNDPIYIKLEKLDIIIKLVDKDNVYNILNELKEYATEVDVDFVRRAVRSIGICAMKVESAADSCVTILIELIQSHVAYIVQESVIVTMDIMRKFPNRYESVIEKLGQNIHILDDPDSRAAFIWIIGEYGDRIDNSPDLLKAFIITFIEESPTVQLQIITAAVKLFLHRPEETQDMLNEVLTLATEHGDNPDIRDRGFVYWRLLSSDPVAAKEVVLAKKEPIITDTDVLNIDIDELLLNMCTLSSIYHKLPSNIIDSGVLKRKIAIEKHENIFTSTKQDATKIVSNESSNTLNPTSCFKPPKKTDLLDFSFNFNEPVKETSSAYITSPLDTITDIFSTMPTSSCTESVTTFCPPASVWLTSSMGMGMEVRGQFNLIPNGISAELNIINNSSVAISSIAIQINTNYFGLKLTSPVQLLQKISPNQSITTLLDFDFNGEHVINKTIDTIQFAFKTNIDLFFCFVSFPFHYFFLNPLPNCINKIEFLVNWNTLRSLHPPVKGTKSFSMMQIQQHLSSLLMFPLQLHEKSCVGGLCKLKNNLDAYIMIEVTSNLCIIMVRSSSSEIVQPITSLLVNVLELV